MKPLAGAGRGAPSAHRRVRPAADGAGVHLGMLHCVRGQVHLQRGRVRVRPVTVVALEGFIFVVLPPVGLRKQGEIRTAAPLCPPASLTLMESPGLGARPPGFSYI